ncbi:hypothetical protein, partial [Nocardia cyriacigeorgica]|uniref:hypothetical protein n=1 Tax=Nocardia cyriacigeorgica TaxID=135487 RepID=UPI0024545DF6
PRRGLIYSTPPPPPPRPPPPPPPPPPLAFRPDHAPAPVWVGRRSRASSGPRKIGVRPAAERAK